MKVDAAHLAALETEGRRLLESAERDPGRTVPFYPDWTLGDLVAHIGSIHALASRVCRDLSTERVTRPVLPSGTDPLPWARSQLDDLVGVLGQANGTSTVWGFREGSTVARWVTRMVVETGVHRWDADQAFGNPDDLPPVVARAGLDEFVTMWFPLMTDVQVLQLTATDLEEEPWAYGKGAPTATVRGPASDLYLALMVRQSSVTLPDDWAKACNELPPPPDL